jgi:hypothetical protein
MMTMRVHFQSETGKGGKVSYVRVQAFSDIKERQRAAFERALKKEFGANALFQFKGYDGGIASSFEGKVIKRPRNGAPHKEIIAFKGKVVIERA